MIVSRDRGKLHPERSKKPIFAHYNKRLIRKIKRVDYESETLKWDTMVRGRLRTIRGKTITVNYSHSACTVTPLPTVNVSPLTLCIDTHPTLIPYGYGPVYGTDPPVLPSTVEMTPVGEGNFQAVADLPVDYRR